MQYEHFIDYIKTSMEQIMGPDTPVQVHSVLKNNSVRLDALTILPEGQTVSPSIYLNDFYDMYQDGTSLPTIIGEINHIYESSINGFVIDPELILNFNYAKDRICFRLINKDLNHDLLKTVPHKEYLDLAVIFYILIQSSDYGDASAIVTNEHMRLWKTSTEVLYQLARENTRAKLGAEMLPLELLMRDIVMRDLRKDAYIYKEEQGIEEMLSEETLAIMADDIMKNYIKHNDRPSMYVITNRARCHGASCILYNDLLVKAGEELDDDYYVLPSSIHEVILYPAGELITEELLIHMVREVNLNEVSVTEQLSDHIYYFNRRLGLLQSITLDNCDSDHPDHAD